jgi:hypothetical protein
MKDLREMTYGLDDQLKAIDLEDLTAEEFEQAFDTFCSRCDRTQQEQLLAILTNVMGIDRPPTVETMRPQDAGDVYEFLEAERNDYRHRLGDPEYYIAG